MTTYNYVMHFSSQGGLVFTSDTQLKGHANKAVPLNQLAHILVKQADFFAHLCQQSYDFKQYDSLTLALAIIFASRKMLKLETKWPAELENALALGFRKFSHIKRCAAHIFELYEEMFPEEVAEAKKESELEKKQHSSIKKGEVSQISANFGSDITTNHTSPADIKLSLETPDKDNLPPQVLKNSLMKTLISEEKRARPVAAFRGDVPAKPIQLKRCPTSNGPIMLRQNSVTKFKGAPIHEKKASITKRVTAAIQNTSLSRYNSNKDLFKPGPTKAPLPPSSKKPRSRNDSMSRGGHSRVPSCNGTLLSA